MPSPNEMVVDTDEYLDDVDGPDAEPVAIINPDNLEAESEPASDKPLATDRMYLNDQFCHRQPRSR